MKIVLQVVEKASVSIKSSVHSQIGEGILLLVGIQEGDTIKDADVLIEKLLNLRLFDSEIMGDNGEAKRKYFDKSLLEEKKEVLIVSQFTLLANLNNGRRPDFSQSMSPKEAKAMYEYFVEKFRNSYEGVIEMGVFGSEMKVELVNDGPITLILESKDFM
jgi:D-tyrosyl-tRNA(Tyr) deacylase